MTLHVDIRKKLGDFQLEVAFDAGAEPLALLGASGCGKSVTLRCIAGILRPDEGRIALDGRVLFDSAARIDLPPQQRRAGYLFQQYALFPNMTVRGNLLAVLRGKPDREAAAADALRRFRLEAVADLRPRQISGGQQQRCALARILLTDPRMILLDEPLSALDSYLKYQLELELAAVMDDFPGPILWVTHDRGEAWRNCPKVCLLENGKSQGVRPMRELFHAPGTESAARLSGCKNFTPAAKEGDLIRLTDWGVTLDPGRPVAEEVRCVGIRSHTVRPAAEGEKNAIPCAVIRVIDDVFEAIILLRPEGAGLDAAPLRMELPKDAWAALRAPERLTVSVAPEDILLLK